MDAKKLEALRAKYRGAKGGEIHDPAFAEVAKQSFLSPDRRRWPFAGVATLLGAPFQPDAIAGDFAGLDVALIGVPMDLGVTNRAGARLGPRAVRAIERIGPYEHALRVAPFAKLRWSVTVGGTHHLPVHTGALLVCNSRRYSLSAVYAAMALSEETERPVRFVGERLLHTKQQLNQDS